VRAVAVELARRLRRAHDGVDGLQHGGRVAARVVAGQQLAAQALGEALRGAEHARVGAAKAVDALLGVAHDEDAGRVQPAAAGAGVARQPGVQRLPLQRVGVLELVDQQMAHARVQALLHVAAEEFVRQQGERGAFDVGQVDPAALALEARQGVDEGARQARHALVVGLASCCRQAAAMACTSSCAAVTSAGRDLPKARGSPFA
jgi:hypothetical protein